MDAWSAAQMRDRYDRHVRHARLSVEHGAPQRRLAFAMEEALRLASLPGENEGRAYYFRRLRIAGLPANGDRNLWLEKFQRGLTDGAGQAMHGAEPRAGFAQAIFFRSEQEALEILLHRMLARRAVPEWFWPMVAASPGESEPPSSPASILQIVEKLRAQPASWVAVAAAVFAPPEFDVMRLLQAIPSSLARGWIREMERSRPSSSRAVPRIPQSAQLMLQQALRVSGFQDVRTLWLAALALLLDSPGELEAGTVVARARDVLRALILNVESRAAQRAHVIPAQTPVQARIPEIEPVPSLDSAKPSSKPTPPQLDAEVNNSSSAVLFASEPNPVGPAALEPILAAEPAGPTADSEISAPTEAALVPRQTVDVEVMFTSPASSPTVAPVIPNPTPWQCAGLPTVAAGLFFLLNALQRIGISEALAAGLASASPNFTARLLQRLAAHAGVTDEDPVAVWLNSLVPNAAEEESLPLDPSWWPVNLQPSRNAAPAEYLVRIWCLAVRRWCWRIGGIRARDVISRGGVFSVNRTDVDVSLPIDEADIRVRRIGLDLDPGWLPWFGRVVRFHYLFRGEFHG